MSRRGRDRVFTAVDWIVIAWLRVCVAILLAPVATIGLVLFAAMWLEEAGARVWEWLRKRA